MELADINPRFHFLLTEGRGYGLDKELTFINAKAVKNTRGIKNSLLKYHRQSGHITGYRLEGWKQWLYKTSDLDRLEQEYMTGTSQSDKISGSTLMEGNATYSA